ncbi:MAG: aspartate/glutamate racemase family protein, partial [Solimonas sp.]
MMGQNRRIVYQLVAPMEKTLGKNEIERRRDYLQKHAGTNTEIAVQSVPSGYASIESERDAVVVAPHIVAGLQRAEAEGAHAGIVGCFSDPAIDAVRETVKMPVVGPGQSAITLALQLGERYAILSPLDSGAKRAIPRLRAQGLAERLAGVRGVGVSVVDLARGGNDAWDRIVATGRRCIDEDGADVLVMGCAGMARYRDRLQRHVGLPVVEPSQAAVSM